MHDITQAWTGIGAAVYALWKQTTVASSTWTLLGVVSVMIAHFFFLSLVLLCFSFISLLAECLIPASRNSLTLFYPDTFGANRSFPRIFSTEYFLVLLNLLSPSLTFHSLCHASHNKHI